MSLFRPKLPLDLNCKINFHSFNRVILVLGLLISAIGIFGLFSGPTSMSYAVPALFLGLALLVIYGQIRALRFKNSRIEELERDCGGLSTIRINHLQVCEIDALGRMVWCNQGFTDCFKYSTSELVGKPISMIHLGGASNRAYCYLKDCLSEKKFWAGESEDVTADGHRIFSHCVVTPILDQAKSLTGAIVVRTNKTDENRLEETSFLINLFDSLHDEVYVYKTDSLGMVYANVSARRACGWSDEKLEEKSILDADPDIDESHFRAHVAPLFSGEKDVVITVVERGSQFGEITTRLVDGESGETFFVSVLRDATQRKQIERAKMETVSVVSHEMRTPLTSIKGALRLLQSGILGRFDNTAKQTLDIAVRNTDQLLLLVDDILDLEKIRAGKMKMDTTAIDLVRLVDDVVEMNRGYADELRVNFQFETNLTKATAYVSATRFTQVLANLLSNAAKFTPAGESVHVTLNREGSFWRISVTDEGPGIPEDEYHTIFASFAQLPSPDGKNRKGTGLGLAIAQRIVHAHNGKIDFVSKRGEGTTFFVDLPMHSSLDQPLDHTCEAASMLEKLNNSEKIPLDGVKPIEI